MKTTVDVCTKPTRLVPGMALLVALLVAPAWAGAPWRIDWWTVDGGGHDRALGADWELSGTLGQWDGTARTRSSGGPWQVTGGFWSLEVSGSDYLFKDGYE